jgi:hypothetical protein
MINSVNSLTKREDAAKDSPRRVSSHLGYPPKCSTRAEERRYKYRSSLPVSIRSLVFSHHQAFTLKLESSVLKTPSTCKAPANMASTSHPEFNKNTEGLEVAKAFADQISGKTILVTGVNLKGIGFATAEAFVSVLSILPWQD